MFFVAQYGVSGDRLKVGSLQTNVFPRHNRNFRVPSMTPGLAADVGGGLAGEA